MNPGSPQLRHLLRRGGTPGARGRVEDVEVGKPCLRPALLLVHVAQQSSLVLLPCPYSLLRASRACSECAGGATSSVLPVRLLLVGMRALAICNQLTSSRQRRSKALRRPQRTKLPSDQVPLGVLRNRNIRKNLQNTETRRSRMSLTSRTNRMRRGRETERLEDLVSLRSRGFLFSGSV